MEITEYKEINQKTECELKHVRVAFVNVAIT